MGDELSEKYAKMSRLLLELSRLKCSSVSGSGLGKARVDEAVQLQVDLLSANNAVIELALEIQTQCLLENNAVEANAIMQLARLHSDGAVARASRLKSAVLLLQKQV